MFERFLRGKRISGINPHTCPVIRSLGQDMSEMDLVMFNM